MAKLVICKGRRAVGRGQVPPTSFHPLISSWRLPGAGCNPRQGTRESRAIAFGSAAEGEEARQMDLGGKGECSAQCVEGAGLGEMSLNSPMSPFWKVIF